MAHDKRWPKNEKWEPLMELDIINENLIVSQATAEIIVFVIKLGKKNISGASLQFEPHVHVFLQCFDVIHREWMVYDSAALYERNVYCFIWIWCKYIYVDLEGGEPKKGYYMFQ